MIDSLVDLLHKGNHTLVVANGDDVRTFGRRGVADLFELLTSNPEFLRGASVADKVVGKGAAALMILGGVARLHTDIISDAAIDLFRDSGVEVSYDTRVPFIANRDHSGRCPVETLCEPCATAAECLPLIESFITRQCERN